MSPRNGRSLQRTLAIRFALTMTAGLLGLGALAYVGFRSVLGNDIDPRHFLVGAVATALTAGLATLVGAWMLARSALAPVAEIAAQAELVRAPNPDRRITVHADVQELRALVGVLNGMLERLDRYCDWHRHIIRALGHDLRTPLATLRAGTELALIRERTPEEYRRVLTQSLEEVDRLTLISDALRLLGRLQWGELVPARIAVDLRDVVGVSVARARERSGGNVVTYDPPADPVEAQADASLVAFALDQVLDNALRHTAPGTPVEVRLMASADGASIVVEDDGEGVPENELAHLFEPFYRGDPARGRAGGAGLGLTTVATIIREHQGRAVAEPGDRGGLRVTIELPASSPEPALLSASSS